MVEAALAIFADGGFEAASMSAIAARAGISKSVLYDCFPGGKQEIFFAALDHGEQAFAEHLQGLLEAAHGQPLAEGLASGLKAFLDYAEVNPLAFRVVFGPAGTSDPEIVRRAERVRDGVVRLMRDHSVAALGLPASGEAAAELYARGIVAVAEELARWSLRRPDLSREALVQMVVVWFMQGFEHLLPGGPAAR